GRGPSERAAQRRVSARPPEDGSPPALLAYRLGGEDAIDRILLGSRDPLTAQTLKEWTRPRLKLGGGDLIAMGLEPGPLVAKTLQAIEAEWAQVGFPDARDVQEALARAAVGQAVRVRQ